ncbi:MAG: winged helix DNA-binding domain-containing protein [Actinomycetota bacterium]
MSERILGERALNRALLARQLLLDRSAMPLPAAIERVSCVQDQYAPSGYLGLWSRVAGLERSALTTALERRRVIQATMMRMTIHLTSRRDFWPLALALRQPRRDGWLRATRRTGDERAMIAAARRVRDLLADGPRRRAEIVTELGLDAGTWNGVGLWLDLVRVPPSGTWERRRADLFGMAEEWLGSPPDGLTPADGVELLVRRYLAAFGPASVKDVVSFTGLSPTAIAPALERLRLRRFRDERGGELLDVPRAPLPDPETPAPVRFLPPWDATLLVHARRTQILPEPLRPRVFHVKVPQSVATFLVDGRVAGTWRHEAGRVVTEPFARLSKATAGELDAEAERLSAFMA